jgi:hypothetical protein
MCFRRTDDSSLTREAGAMGDSGFEYLAKPGVATVGFGGSGTLYSHELMYEYILNPFFFLFFPFLNFWHWKKNLKVNLQKKRTKCPTTQLKPLSWGFTLTKSTDT